jgi:hypothetical protein
MVGATNDSTPVTQQALWQVGMKGHMPSQSARLHPTTIR